MASKSPTLDEISSSGHRFRFFVVLHPCLGCDALFVSSFSSLCPCIASFVSSCCPFCCIAFFVSSWFSSIRRRLHELVSSKSAFLTNGVTAEYPSTIV